MLAPIAEACYLFRQSADLNDLTFVSCFIHATAAVDQELFDIAGMILLR
jgi:hypothetical protein